MSKRPTFLYETNDAIKKYLGTYLEFDITSHHITLEVYNYQQNQQKYFFWIPIRIAIFYNTT